MTDELEADTDRTGVCCCCGAEGAVGEFVARQFPEPTPIPSGRVAEVVEISEGGVGSEGLAKEEPTPWTELRQPRRRRH
jgi:hypothetical protein